MYELKCPKCGEVFQADEAGYAAIVKQVRDSEFNKEIERREKQFDEAKTNALKLAQAEADKNLTAELKRKEDVIADLVNKQIAADGQIQNLSTQLERERETASKVAKAELEKEYLEKLQEQEKKIFNLENEKSRIENEKKSQMQEELHKKDILILEKDGDIQKLSDNLRKLQQDKIIDEQNLKEDFSRRLQDKEKEVEYYKDLKVRQSTKMVGETLEQHCEIEFNKLRATAFKKAQFGKDNDASSGSKGDYIFRDFDEFGNEVISIMFEMKNQCDTTSTKKKNEHFFKELDKDRNEKKCEYAVLVSLLELDNEFYNSGIADVSYQYQKMYVVRPQNFITIITLLRDAALNSMEYKQQLVEVKNQNLDIANFEANMADFKARFGRNYELASKQFQTAIGEIDKSITHLTKIKEALTSSINNLRLANEKAEDLSIKKLTANSPTVRAMFDELKNK